MRVNTMKAIIVMRIAAFLLIFFMFINAFANEKHLSEQVDGKLGAV